MAASLMTSLLETIKRLYGKTDSLQTASAALAKIEAELAGSRDALSLAEGTYGADLVAASGNDIQTAAIEADLARKRQAVTRGSAAVAAVRGQVQAFEAEKADAAERDRWQQLAKALDERAALLAVVAKDVDTLAKSMLEAQAIGQRVHDLLPRKVLHTGDAIPTRIGPTFTHLEGEVGVLLSLASNGKLGSMQGQDSDLFELRKEPGLLARADKDARNLLALSPYGRPDPTFPQAA